MYVVNLNIPNEYMSNEYRNVMQQLQLSCESNDVNDGVVRELSEYEIRRLDVMKPSLKNQNQLGDGISRVQLRTYNQIQQYK